MLMWETWCTGLRVVLLFLKAVFSVRGVVSGSSICYHLKDLLGSIRAIVDGSGRLLEENDYYAFGQRHPRSEQAQFSANRFKYNGKELQTVGGLGYLDYGARMYDQSLGRWFTTDPLSEKYYGLSPYVYCGNNPLRYVDPDGKKIVDAKGNVIYTHKGGWIKNAPKDAMRLGNAMMETRTGTMQFNKMVDVEYGITLNISQNISISQINGKISYKLGEAKKSINYDSNTGKFKINSVAIIVYEGTLNKYLKNAKTSKADAYRISVKNNDQAIGAIGAHESVHATDSQNIKESFDNIVKGTSYDIEKEANKIELKVLDEIHIPNPNPYKTIKVKHE